MFLLFRSDSELISGRARTSATRLSRLSGDADAVLPASLASAGPISGLSDGLAGFPSRPMAVTRSAIPVASTTCCWIVRGAEAGAAAAAAGNAAISGVQAARQSRAWLAAARDLGLDLRLGGLRRRRRGDGGCLRRLRPVGAFQFALRHLASCDGLFYSLFWSHCRRGRRNFLRGCLSGGIGGGGPLRVRRLGVQVLAFDAAMPARGAVRETGAGCLATRAAGMRVQLFLFPPQPAPRRWSRVPRGAGQTMPEQTRPYRTGTRCCTAARRYKRCRVNRADLLAGPHSNRATTSGSAKSIFST